MSTTPKRQGMAITSLVLGVLSMMCFGLFAGIPAIILGHMAYGRSRKVPDQFGGGGLAIAGFVLGYMSILTTLILAGLLLPALAKAKSKAQTIKCVNNMKNIGLAFRIYATDNHDRFPFNVSTNQAGAVKVGKAGQDPVRVFQMLANELSTPKLLVCPGDSGKQPALNFQSLSSGNVSYELGMGPEVDESNPQSVLARCPIHGTVLMCDGSVQQRPGWR